MSFLRFGCNVTRIQDSEIEGKKVKAFLNIYIIIQLSGGKEVRANASCAECLIMWKCDNSIM